MPINTGFSSTTELSSLQAKPASSLAANQTPSLIKNALGVLSQVLVSILDYKPPILIVTHQTTNPCKKEIRWKICSRVAKQSRSNLNKQALISLCRTDYLKILIKQNSRFDSVSDPQRVYRTRTNSHCHLFRSSPSSSPYVERSYMLIVSANPPAQKRAHAPPWPRRAPPRHLCEFSTASENSPGSNLFHRQKVLQL